MPGALRKLSWEGSEDYGLPKGETFHSTFVAIDDHNIEQRISIHVDPDRISEPDLDAFLRAIRCRKWLEDNAAELALSTGGGGLFFVGWGGHRDSIELRGGGELVFSESSFYFEPGIGYEYSKKLLQVDLSDCDTAELERVASCLSDGLRDPRHASPEPQAGDTHL